MDYLLSDAHPVGRAKAKFFRAAGFDETNVVILQQCLITLAQTEEVKEVISSPHGTKYVIEGALSRPAGGLVHVRTVWIIEPGEDRPRFVTAYPQ